MFPCPTCGSRLMKTQAAGGNFLICSSCRGTAVRISQLTKMASEKVVTQLWSEVRAARDESKQSCPVCGKSMVMTTVKPDDRAFALDACMRCQLIWFDAQELERMPPHESSPEPSPELLRTGARVEALLLTERARAIEAERVSEGEEELKGTEWLALLLGMPVEYFDTPKKREPWLTLWLTAAIGLVSVCAFLDVPRAAQAFGFIPSDAWRYWGMTLVSSFFLHGDVFHLAGNLYFLLVFGDNVEEVLGGTRYLLLLAAATVAGDLLYAAFFSNSPAPLIGASGGISGVITFYALAFPQARVGFFWAFPFYRWVRMSVGQALILWLVLQAVGAVAAMVLGQGTGVAFHAHLGGALMGLAAWAVWKRSS